MNEARLLAPSCDYCGLPLAGSVLGGRRTSAATAQAGSGTHPSAEAQPSYCCLGCRVAASVTGTSLGGNSDSARAGAESAAVQTGQTRFTLVRLGVAIFFSMNVMVFTLALWSQDVYEINEQPTSQALFELYRYGCLLFSLPVLFLLGGPLLEQSFDQLRRGRPGTDLLLALGVAAAFAYSCISTLRGSGHVYFEVSCMVLVAVTLGRWLEAVGKLKTTESLSSLSRLLPQEVRRRGEDNSVITVPLAEIVAGDQLQVLHGERIPADGQITSGRASLDEQLITGRSVPMLRQAGDTVFGGTLNLDGDLLVRVTAVGEEGTLGRLARAVREAALSKDRYQRLADRLAAWFLPLVVLIAIGTVVLHAAQGDWETGMLAALAVALIACPCALALATPMAIFAALGRASAKGVLFRDGEAIGSLSRLGTIFLDKTGTLTTGQPRVQSLVCADGADREQVLRQAAALSARSNHALSQAIGNFAQAEDSRDGLLTVEDVTNVAGRGLLARLTSAKTAGEETVYLGSQRLMEENSLQLPPTLATAIEQAKVEQNPVTCLGAGGQVLGVFTFGEAIRDHAAEVLANLRQRGANLQAITGDHVGLPESLGIETTTGMLPAEKLAHVEAARQSDGPVAMVGDGVNDAPALAAADVGIAMGCGADVSREAADVCLLGDDLPRIPWSISLAQRTVKTIRQNLLWAFSYNVGGIALAATGRLNPVIAALAMIASSFLVISNSLRLAGWNEPLIGESDTDAASGFADRTTQQDGKHGDIDLSPVDDLPNGSASEPNQLEQVTS